MTHNQATFIVLATDGENVFFGLSETGETSVGNYDTRLDAVARMLTYESRFAAERPLVVVIGKNKTRATAGEKFLEGFARDIVRVAVASLPETLPVYVAGSARVVSNSYYTPRIASTPLPWATKSTPMKARVRSLLTELAFGDEGLELIPKGLTHAGA